MSATEGLEWVEARKTREAETTAWGDEERKTWKTPVDHFLADFKPDVVRDRSQVPVIEGTLGGSGTITGEKTFTGTFSDGPFAVPVTLTYRYTLTTVPPGKK